MNLHRLLAENMARFGTKNLNESHFKTLLNEGTKPGDVYNKPDYTIQAIVDPSGPAELTAYASQYKSLRFKMAGTDITGEQAALLAVWCATYAQLQTGKKTKSIAFGNVIDALDGGGTTTELDAIIPILPAVISTITYNKTTVDVYPTTDTRYPNSVATIGKAITSVDMKGVQTLTSYGSLVNYLNSYNAGNVETYDFTQYDLSNMVDSNNYVNLLGATISSNSLILYTSGDKAPNVANKDIQTTSKTVGGTAPVSKDYDVAFAQGSAVIAANDAEVAKAVQDAITMFPDGNISNLTILSSASPEYGAIKNIAGWEKNYTATSGTTDPGAGTTDATKNMKLAYDRGVSFMNALNAGLEAAGKPQVQGYTINWQIAGDGGPLGNGRFTQVQWEKAGTAPVTTTDTTAVNTGTEGGKISGMKTFNYFKHVWSWGTAAAATPK